MKNLIGSALHLMTANTISSDITTVIRGIKISTTTFARKNQIPFEWQRSFHDRIIRDTAEMNRIAEYIENNVAEWDLGTKNI